MDPKEDPQDAINTAARSLVRTHGASAASKEASHMADKWAQRDPKAAEFWRQVSAVIQAGTSEPGTTAGL